MILNGNRGTKTKKIKPKWESDWDRSPLRVRRDPKNFKVRIFFYGKGSCINHGITEDDGNELGFS